MPVGFSLIKETNLPLFLSGLILVVTFDDIDAINSLWELHLNNKLTPMFQDILIDGALLKAMEAKRVSIRAKLWEDEYNDSKMELLERGMDRLSLDKFRKFPYFSDV